MLKKIIAIPLTILFYVLFGINILIFHLLQLICFYLFGYLAHKKVVDILNLFIVKSFYILGASIHFNGFSKIPSGRPLIIISNHQSAWDIPPIAWGFRKYHPKYIAKAELARNIPSISFNLKHGGSAVIDRNKGSQSIREVIKVGERVERDKYAICIFPEGTRSKDGRVKKFQTAGIKTLLKAAPSAVIIPFVIDGNVNLQKPHSWIMNLGINLHYSVLDPVEPNGRTAEELVEITEQAIRRSLHQTDDLGLTN